MATRTLLTIDDFERLPDDVARNKELVDGELVEVSGNNPLHNVLKLELAAILLAWLKRKGLGRVLVEQEFDFLGNAHGPDIAFITSTKEAVLDWTRRVQRFVPDLAVEIPSPNDTYSSIVRKIDRYLSAGTQEVWLIDTEPRQISVFTRDVARIYRGSDSIATDLLPGWTVTVDELFAEL